MEIKFKSGEMLPYMVKKTFTLGNSGITLARDTELSYDGTRVEYNGEHFVSPQLRGAIKAGWVTPLAEYEAGDTECLPVSANVQVRPAIETKENGKSRHSIVTAETDERVVGNSKGHAEATRAQNKSRFQARSGGIVKTQNGMEVVEDQSGVVIDRSFKTSAKDRMELTDASLGDAMRKANSVTIVAGRGVTEDELLEKMSKEQAEEYLAEKESRKQAIFASDPRSAKLMDQPTRTKVSKVRSGPKVVEKEGMTIHTTTGGGTEIVDLSDASAKAEVTESFVEGIKVTNTNGPRRDRIVQPARPEVQPKVIKDGTVEWRLKLARQICKDFPKDYNFGDHWKRRIAMIRLHYEGRPDVIQAIFAAESDDFKSVLLSEFPEVFSEESAQV